MKRNRLILLAGAISLMSFFTACSDDDGPLYRAEELNQDFGSLLNGDALSLTYGGEPLTGKKVAFHTDDSKTATLTLTDVVPGEAETVISNVALTAASDVYHLSGQTTTAGGALVKVSGTVSPKNLSVNFDVTMSTASQGGINGVWKMADSIHLDMEAYEILFSPVHLAWTSAEKYNFLTHSIGVMSHALVDQAICQLLQKVNLSPDGNVTASYASELTDDIMTLFTEYGANFMIKPQLESAWKPSPKNLAYWYVKENTLILVPNLNMIVAQVMKDSGNDELDGLLDHLGINLSSLVSSLRNMNPATVRSLLALACQAMDVSLDLSNFTDEQIKVLIGYITTGIPLHYARTDEGLRVWLDHATLDPLMPVVFSMLPTLQEQVDASGMGDMLGFFGIQKLTDLVEVWNQTTNFELGLNFWK